MFGRYSLVHDVLSDEESTTETTNNKNVESNNAFNVFSTLDDDQTKRKTKYDINSIRINI